MPPLAPKRVTIDRPASLDEQVWPVNVAILVLAAFVQGIIIARLRFDDPDVWHNGWTWTATLAATIGLGLWGITKIKAPSSQRRVQLATALSLIFHLALLFVLNQHFAVPREEQATAREELVTIEIPPPQSDHDETTPRDDFQTPTPTTVATLETPAVQEKPQQRPDAKTPTPVPTPAKSPTETPPQPVTAPTADPQRTTELVARRSESTAERSRNAATSEVTPSPAASAQSPSTSGKPRPVDVEAQARSERTAPSSVPSPQQSASAPSSLRPDASPAVTPRAKSAPETSSAAASRPIPGKTQRPVAPPRSEAPLASATGRPTQTDPRAIQPRNLADSRRAAAPTVERADAAPSDAPPKIADLLTPGQQAPTASSTNRTEEARSTTAATQQPGRAARAPELAGSPAEAVAPQTAPARPSASPEAAAGSSSLAQRHQGLSGNQPALNFGAGPSGADRPATTPSSAAPRATAAQQSPAGDAPAPSRVAVAPRRRATADLPGSRLPVQESPNALAGGSARPAQFDADAGAQTQNLRSRAAPGTFTADAGSGPADTGPQQVVAERKTGRPAGGGQEQIGEINPSQRSLPRRGGGGVLPADSPTPALAATSPTPGTGAKAAVADPSAQAAGAARATTTGPPQPGAASADAAPQLTGVTGAPSAANAPATTDRGTTGGPASSTAQATRRTGSVAVTPAPVPSLAGAPHSSGTPNGNSVDATGMGEKRSVEGLAGRPDMSTPSGNGPPTQETVEVSVPSDAGAGRATGDGIAAGAPQASASGGAKRRERIAGVAPSADGAAATPQLAGKSPTAAKSGELEPAGADTGNPGRRDGGPRTIVPATEGPGGLGPALATDSGVVDRRARVDEPLVTVPQARFQRRSLASLPSSLDLAARLASEPFGGRKGRKYTEATGPGELQPGARTEQSVELGLEFLARMQAADGSWSLHNFPGRTAADAGTIKSDAAATGLALLAYFGAAYDHYGDRYQHVVGNGLKWLVARQQPDGNLYVSQQDPASDASARIYTHAIATIALTEAYGMTGDPTLREPAQKAIDFLVKSQHPQYGGWRYGTAPNMAGYSTDTSVTGWAVMALRSGELARLNVPTQTYAKVRTWLDVAQGPGGNGARYAYDPQLPDAASGQFASREALRKPSPSMTGVGLLLRLYLGWDRNRREVIEGADYLLAHPPRLTPAAGADAYHARDTYYWYYATQVLYHMGGERWQKWNEQLHPLLTQSQIKTGPLAGSWDPKTPTPDAWSHAGGRLYVTTLNLLSLEVYYRHLPLYDDTAR